MNIEALAKILCLISTNHLAAEYMRIFRNCRTFNEKLSEYYKFANIVDSAVR